VVPRSSISYLLIPDFSAKASLGYIACTSVTIFLILRPGTFLPQMHPTNLVNTLFVASPTYTSHYVVRMKG